MFCKPEQLMNTILVNGLTLTVSEYFPKSEEFPETVCFNFESISAARDNLCQKLMHVLRPHLA